MVRRDELARSERYADDMPLSLSYRQLPPTADPASKQSNGMPRASRTWHEAIPDDPAPITHTRPVSGVPLATEPGISAAMLVTLGKHALRRHPQDYRPGTYPAGVGFAAATG